MVQLSGGLTAAYAVATPQIAVHCFPAESPKIDAVWQKLNSNDDIHGLPATLA